MREAECARSNLAEDLSRLRMELEKVASLVLYSHYGCMLCYVKLLGNRLLPAGRQSSAKWQRVQTDLVFTDYSVRRDSGVLVDPALPVVLTACQMPAHVADLP